MDGTAIMQGIATVFIALAYGVDLQITDYLMVILTIPSLNWNSWCSV